MLISLRVGDLIFMNSMPFLHVSSISDSAFVRSRTLIIKIAVEFGISGFP